MNFAQPQRDGRFVGEIAVHPDLMVRSKFWEARMYDARPDPALRKNALRSASGRGFMSLRPKLLKGVVMSFRSIAVVFPLFASLSLFILSAPATATVITFNEFVQGTNVTTQYANVGALFSVSGSTPASIVDIGPDTIVADNVNIATPTPVSSPPNALRINGGQPFNDILFVDFVDPMNSTIMATMTSVSFSFVSDVAGIGSIKAFDASGMQVDQAISMLGGTSNNDGQAFETLTVTGSAIARVAIDGFADVIIDELTFTSDQSVSVSEPGTLFLLVVGLLGLGVARRKLAA